MVLQVKHANVPEHAIYGKASKASDISGVGFIGFRFLRLDVEGCMI